MFVIPALGREAGLSRVRGQPQLCSDFQSSLGLHENLLQNNEKSSSLCTQTHSTVTKCSWESFPCSSRKFLMSICSYLFCCPAMLTLSCLTCITCLLWALCINGNHGYAVFCIQHNDFTRITAFLFMDIELDNPFTT